MPQHWLARVYVAFCVVFTVAMAWDFANQLMLRADLEMLRVYHSQLAVVVIAAAVVGKYVVVAPPHELIHAWQLRRAGIPNDAIRYNIFTLGNAWVSAPDYAISYREALPVLLAPLILAVVLLPLTMLHSPFHFGFVLMAFGATVGPLNDVAVASRLWDIHRTDPDVHFVERMGEGRAPRPYTTSLREASA